MSKIALEGNSLGSGTFTIAAPNSNSNPTLTLPTSSGTVVVTGGAQTIEFAAGSAASPSITFTGDTNTGIFSPAADTIAFTEGGAEAMRIDSSGKVLIGTTSTSGTSNSANNLVVGSNASADETGITLGSTAASGIRWNDGSDAGVIEYVHSTNYMRFVTAAAERMRIDSSGRVGIANTSPSSYYQFADDLVIGSSGSTGLSIVSGTTSDGTIAFADGTSGADTYRGYIQYKHDVNALTFGTDGSERARIASDGVFMVAKTTTDSSTQGLYANPAGSGFFHLVVTNTTSTTNQSTLYLNRQTSDGRLIEFRQADTSEGDISVSGTTVSYNGGHLSRYAQTTTAKDDSLLKGTVLANLDEMNVYVAPTTYWTEKDELPEGVNVGDVKVETHTVNNEQLNKVKVSDVEGDVNVAGVFVNWSHDEAHNVDEINMAMTGDMIIRIAQGVVVQKGDLLMSAGDGTAKPQGDDIVRSKTVAKVTSNHVTCTYEDGSYCVPCVLMAC